MKKLSLSFVLFIVIHLTSAQVVNLDIKVFLEGPYFNDQMTPFLNVLGYLPGNQPYNNEPWNYEGSEAVGAIPSFNVVDWVLVDLLKPTGDTINQSFELIARKAGFILTDGTITDLDGISYLPYTIGNITEFYVQIHHRNHLPVTSAIPLTETKGVYSYNFTTDAEKAIGGVHSQKQMTPGVWSMYAADGNASNQIDNRDKNEVWVPQQGNFGYLEGDYNMDSQVDEDDKIVKWSENVGHGINIQIYPPYVFTCGDTVTDPRDGNTYTTVLIGEQCWMVENLNIGTRIDGTSDQTDNGIIEKYCYNNEDDSCNVYGGLYQWNELMQYVTIEGAQGICPEGWYIPTDDDWKILEGTVDSQFGVGNTIWDQGGWRGFDAGKNLKSLTGWASGGNGTDSFGFSALPGGVRTTSGFFATAGTNGYFWTSGLDLGLSLQRELVFYFDGISRSGNQQANGFSIRCIKGIDNQPPNEPSNPKPEDGSVNISIDTTLSWSCSDPDGDDLTYNIYFGTETNPQLIQTIHPDTFYSPGILLYDTTYYWKIVAYDIYGDSTEGVIWSFSTKELFECGDILIDNRDGQTYNTVQIGEQCWMVENLNIGTRVDGMNDQINDGIVEKYCSYDLDSNCDIYGGLYQWDEMMDYTTIEGQKGICPSGWHLPTGEEWKMLEGAVDSQYGYPDPEWDNEEWRGFDAGLNLKSASGWYSGNNGADLFGFTILPGGYRYPGGDWGGNQMNANFWTSTVSDNSYAWYRGLNYYNDGLYRIIREKYYGYSVRCLKGEAIPPWGCGDTLIDDRDGKTYNTVQIGEQCWMAENLNVGTRIDGVNDQIDDGITEKYCYDDNENNCDTYGGLYQWDEMMQYVTNEGVQGICPTGWHLPTDEEWKQLEGEVDSQYGYPDPEWDGIDWRGFDAGLNLKSVSGWYTGGNGTDLYGFTALPGGFHSSSGVFDLLTYGATFWSSSEYSEADAWLRGLYFNLESVYRNYNYKGDGRSVRCLKGETAPNQPPSQPDNPQPGDGSTNINIDTTLSWSCSDPDGDDLTYNIYFGTETNPPLIQTIHPDTFYSPGILLYDTTYYWKVVAYDIHGDSTEGDVWNFTTKLAFECGDPLLDKRDGQTYNTVQIGEQCWMAENLNIGTRIDGVNDQIDDGITEKYCYDDNENNCDTYGGLYQWNEMMQYVTTEGVQGICPTGWHLPTDAEWCTLENEVDAGTVSCTATGWRGTDAGGNLKETGTIHWNSPNTGATNYSGFTALGSGYRGTNGSFGNLTNHAHYWSSNEDGSLAWHRSLEYSNAQVSRGNHDKAYGFSSRCIEDSPPPTWSCGDTLVDDRDNQIYTTVQIGTQCWMRENLNIGTRIDGVNDQIDNDTIEKYCYNNVEDSCGVFGGLYQWYEMMQYLSIEGAQGICPPDWHIPTDEEWKQLEGEVDSQYGYPDPEWDDTGERGFDAGLNLKSISGWSYGGNGTDLYGFTTLPGGIRNTNGSFNGLTHNAYFRSSSESSSSYTWIRYLTWSIDNVYRFYNNNTYGFSLRCLKD